MTIVEIHGGALTRRKLDKKSKHDIIGEYLMAAEQIDRLSDRLAKLEDEIRALSQTIEAESDRHQQSWRNGASLHYEGRADQAADDADRLRTLLQE